MAIADKHINQSVVKAFKILDCFTENRKEWRVSDLAKAINSNKSTVYRLLATLEQLGVIQQDADSEMYALGLKLLDLGGRANAAEVFSKSTANILQSVVDEIEETAHVGVLRNSDILYIGKLESAQGLKISTNIGSTRPAYCTGLGKILLAYLEEDLLAKALSNLEIKAFTKNTISSKTNLRWELRKIKEQAYAIDEEELEYGLLCLAVPIFNQENKVIAGLSVSGPSQRFDYNELDHYLSILRRAAKNLGDQMGSHELTQLAS